MCRLLLVLLVVVPSAVAHAQTPGRRLAFLVGVKEYDHSQLKPLDFPERDVDDFADVLTKSGFDKVVVLTTGRGARDASLKPTVENIDSHLDRLLTPKNRADGLRVTKHDTILVALAGHGIQPLGSDLAYFCPQDANPTIIAAMGTTPGKAKFPETLVAIDALLAKLDDSGVGHKLLLMDACRNDPGVRGGRRDAGGVNRVKVSALPPQTAVLLSCSPGQFAFEHKDFGGGHGAFFHHVIEGFRGAAVDAEEGGVTFDSLVKHVGRTVPKSVNAVFGKDGGEQLPNRIINLSTNTLLLARVVPIKPASNIPKHEPTKPSPANASKSGTLAKGTKAGLSWDGNTLKMVFCWCPDGKFTRGSPEDEPGRDDDEGQDMETLKGFWIGRHEITQEEWALVMRKTVKEQRDKVTPSFSLAGEGAKRPMYYVSHAEAREFARKYTEQEITAGRLTSEWEYRLPTEAEWEYACRSGTTTAFAFGAALKATDAKFSPRLLRDDKEGTIDVTRQRANDWDIAGMHGNVWEWCTDPYNSGEQPIRGGSWDSPASACRSASRSFVPATRRANNIGFRLVIAPTAGG